MGRTVFVTGASGGIGGAIARAFALGGDRVVLGAFRHPERTEALAALLRREGGTALAVQANVARGAEVEKAFTQIEQALGPVEVLVNNAGHAGQSLFTDIGEEAWDEMFAVHVKGAFLCSKRALGPMIQKKAGCIVNISSIWGGVGASCEVHYSAAKAALEGMTRALAKEVAPSGIRVNCLAPGAVETEMLAAFSAGELQALREEIPMGRLASPEEIAGAAVFLASPAASYVTGQVLGANGGWAT